MASTTFDLQRHLRPLQRRLRLRDTLALAQRSAWLPGTLCVLVQAVGRLVPIPHLVFWSLAPLGLWLAGLLGYLLVRRITPVKAARRADLMLGLRERFSTALELNTKPELDEVEQLQQADALAVASRVAPRQLGWAFDRRSLAYFAGPLLLGLLLNFVPNPQERILAQRAAVQQSLEQTVKAIDKQAEALKQNQALSAAERERLLKELEALKQQLQANQGREEALAKLSTAEAQLKQRLDPQSDARQAGLEQLARRLQESRGEQSGLNAQASEADEELQKLADEIAKLTPEQQQQLASALEQQATELANSDPALAQALQAAADALRNGDAAAASQQLSQAAQQANNANQQLADNQAREQTLSRLQEGRQSIAQAGQQ
ncbi:MAG: hypothetical protein CYG59_07515, partial [Chloroflexi bacterium]